MKEINFKKSRYLFLGRKTHDCDSTWESVENKKRTGAESRNSRTSLSIAAPNT